MWKRIAETAVTFGHVIGRDVAGSVAATPGQPEIGSGLAPAGGVDFGAQLGAVRLRGVRGKPRLVQRQEFVRYGIGEEVPFAVVPEFRPRVVARNRGPAATREAGGNAAGAVGIDLDFCILTYEI